MPETSAVVCLKRLPSHCHERAVIPFSPMNPDKVMSQNGLRFTLDVDGLTPTATAVVGFL